MQEVEGATVPESSEYGDETREFDEHREVT
jgi:hypothetical protein